MKFQISSQAKEYLAKRQKHELTIELYTPKMCCGSGTPSLICYAGPPKEKKFPYWKVTVENYTVYVDPQLDFSKHKVTVTTEKYLMMNSLTASAEEE